MESPVTLLPGHCLPQQVTRCPLQMTTKTAIKMPPRQTLTQHQIAHPNPCQPPHRLQPPLLLLSLLMALLLLLLPTPMHLLLLLLLPLLLLLLPPHSPPQPKGAIPSQTPRHRPPPHQHWEKQMPQEQAGPAVVAIQL